MALRLGKQGSAPHGRAGCVSLQLRARPPRAIADPSLWIARSEPVVYRGRHPSHVTETRAVAGRARSTLRAGDQTARARDVARGRPAPAPPRFTLAHAALARATLAGARARHPPPRPRAREAGDD